MSAHIPMGMLMLISTGMSYGRDVRDTRLLSPCYRDGYVEKDSGGQAMPTPYS